MHRFWPCLALAGYLFSCVFCFAFSRIAWHSRPLTLCRESLSARTSLIVFAGIAVDGAHHRPAPHIFFVAPSPGACIDLRRFSRPSRDARRELGVDICSVWSQLNISLWYYFSRPFFCFCTARFIY